MPNFTKQAIKASFLKLLNEQPLSKISVRSIVEDCGINRNSFYYHFQDIPALVEEIVRDEVDALIAKYPSIHSLNECADVALRFARENKRAVLHLYHSVSRDVYEQNAMRLCEYAVTTYLDSAFGKEAVSEQDHQAAIRFFKCALYGLICDWIENGMDDAAGEELNHIIGLCRGLSDEIILRSRQNAAPV